MRMWNNTEKLYNTFSKFFHNLSYQGLVISINALTISVKGFPPNSNIWIQRRGSGKSELLRALYRGNPEHIVMLPEKFFETSIVYEFDKNWFENKVWVHDDLIVLFNGLTTKQRHQLMGFFTQFLSSGRYMRVERRDNIEIEGRISCIFPMALENFSVYGKSMFYHTLVPDRLVPIGAIISAKDLLNATDKILYRGDDRELAIKLPFTNEPIDIYIPNTYKYEIKRMAGLLQILTGLSATRGVKYTENMVKAHALLNYRNEVVKEDIEVIKALLGMHWNPGDTALEIAQRYLFEKLLELDSVQAREIRDLLKSNGYTERTIKRVIKDLKRYCPYTTEGGRIIFYL